MTDQKHGGDVVAPARVVIDGSYFRDQARDAVRTFIAPLHGVYTAATGAKSESAGNEKRRQKKQA